MPIDDEVLQKILGMVKGGASDGYSEKVYRDEPLIMTAAQLKKPVPTEYRQLRQIAREEAPAVSNREIFYHQAKFMEAFEDSFDHDVAFFHYYPTYADMTLDQMRTYFTWRTRMRRGDIQRTSTSYAFVYIYELLMQIGCTGPEDALEKLRAFADLYGTLDSSIRRYTKQWIFDFAVVNRLSPALLDGCYNAALDEALSRLTDFESLDTGTQFETLKALSNYKIEKSKMYKAQPETTQRAICEVYLELCRYYAKHGKKTYPEKLFGMPYSAVYWPFFGASVYHQRYPDCEVRLSDVCEFHCRDGSWTKSVFYRDAAPSADLGGVMHAVDRTLRDHFGVKPPLKPKKETKLLQNIIDKVIEQVCAPAAPPAPRLELDLTKLAGIRTAADATGEKLMTEEERYIEPAAPKAAASPAEPISQESEEDSVLPKVQAAYLRLLFLGEDTAAFVQGLDCSVDLFVDQINEQLYDVIGDTVLEFGSDGPCIIEDYREDLKDILKL